MTQAVKDKFHFTRTLANREFRPISKQRSTCDVLQQLRNLFMPVQRRLYMTNILYKLIKRTTRVTETLKQR